MSTGVLGDDIRAQLRNAYANMQLAVENAGGTLDNVAHVSMYWANWSTDLVAQIIALPGIAAKAIEIPWIHHNDWMSLGGRNGALVTTSRIFVYWRSPAAVGRMRVKRRFFIRASTCGST